LDNLGINELVNVCAADDNTFGIVYEWSFKRLLQHSVKRHRYKLSPLALNFYQTKCSEIDEMEILSEFVELAETSFLAWPLIHQITPGFLSGNGLIDGGMYSPEIVQAFESSNSGTIELSNVQQKRVFKTICFHNVLARSDQLLIGRIYNYIRVLTFLNRPFSQFVPLELLRSVGLFGQWVDHLPWNSFDNKGHNMLHFLATKPEIPDASHLVHELIVRGADVNSRSFYCETPLILACFYYTDTELILTLIDH